MKNPDEIQDEIDRLSAIKPEVPETTSFGDNNHAAIDSQIETLERQYSEDDIWERHEVATEDELFHSDSERDNAIDASRWLNEESDTAPSSEWEELAG